MGILARIIELEEKKDYLTFCGTKWREMSFCEVLELMKPRLEFHCKTKTHMIEGMDYDDIYQELSLTLHKVLPKIPQGIEYLDFRFTKYMDRVFTMRLYEIRRSKMIRSKYNKGIYEPKDLLDKCDVDYEEVASLASDNQGQNAHFSSTQRCYR